MIDRAIPRGAVYAGATNEVLRQPHKDGFIPTAFDPASCEQRGYLRVGRKRVPRGATKAPSTDSLKKGARMPYNDGRDKDKSGFDIYYELHGRGGELVVFVTGLHTTCFGWLAQVEHLTKDERYSCLVLDNRAFGNSETPAGRYTTSEMAKDVFEVCDHLGWSGDKSLHVVGISMGGMIGLEMAKAAAKRIRSLTLISTTSGWDWKRKSVLDTLPPLYGVRTVIELIGSETLGFSDSRAQVRRICAMLFPSTFLDSVDPADDKGRTHRETMQDVFAYREEFLRGQTTYGILAQLLAIVTHSVSAEDLKRIDEEIQVKTIITGNDDNLVKPANSFHLQKYMPHAKLHVIPGAGHVAVAQTPDQVNTILDEAFALARKSSQRVDQKF